MIPSIASCRAPKGASAGAPVPPGEPASSGGYTTILNPWRAATRAAPM